MADSQIFKFRLDSGVGNTHVLRMPKGSTILSVQEQYEKPTLWVSCPSGKEDEDRRFRLVLTGDTHPTDWKHVGTVLLNRGAFVLHIFEAPHG